MNKKIKILMAFNFIGYIFMILLSLKISNGEFISYNNIIKFILGNMPYLIILLTSFVLANDRFTDLKIVKIEAILDWVIRIIAFGSTIYYTSNVKNIRIALVILIVLMVVNVSIELIMLRKMKLNETNIELSEELKISYEEKCNLGHMVKAVNSSVGLIFIFFAFALSVPINKNMEGAKLWYIPVVISIAVFALYISRMKENYEMFFIYKDNTRKIYIRDMRFALVYTFCFWHFYLHGKITLGDKIIINYSYNGC